MVASILAFELFRRLRRLSTYVYFLVLFALGFLFVLMSGGTFPSATVDFGTGGKVLVTSPFALNVIVTYISFFGVIVTAALAGQATYQDVESNSTAFFYTAPITTFQYLAGRFLGALAVQLVIFTSVGLGAWAGSRMPWLDPERVGPQTLLAYLQPYLTLVIPNLIFTTAIFFALAALWKKMLPVYAGSVLLLIGYFVAAQLSNDLSVSARAALIDPFGGNAVTRVTQYWTPFERNARLVPFGGVLLWNRVLWLAVSGAVLLVTYARFSFTSSAGWIPRRPTADQPETPSIIVSRLLPAVHRTFAVGDSLRQLVSLTRLQFAETIRNVFFAVLVLAGALMDILFANGVNSPFSTRVYPVTWRMLEMGGAGFSLFVLAIVTFYAGELVWRERDARFNQIVDALPTRGWVLFGSKLLALMLVQVLLVLMVMACGLFVQIGHGYYRFEPGLYLTDLFAHRLVSFWILCVVALLVHTTVNQKHLGHFVMVLYFVAGIVLPRMNFQDYLYRIGQLPAVVYSDMNGYGPYALPLMWFEVYWGIGAIILAVVTNLLWVRGMERGWRQRLRLAFDRVTRPVRLSLAFLALLFAAVGGYIYDNTHIVNAYQTTFSIQAARARYETRYKRYQALAQPRITDIHVEVDLYPEKRLTLIRGQEWLENKTDASIDRVAITLWPEDVDVIPRPHIDVQTLSFDGGQTPILEDPALGFYLYRLPRALPPHGRIRLDFAIAYPNPGFVNANPNGDIVRNGSFVNSSYLPFVGYFQDVQLVDDSARHRLGLAPAAGRPKLEDAAARQRNYLTADADWVTFDGTVSTSLDQIAIMPGRLEKEWVQDGRRHFHYKSDAPIVSGIFSVNSARYAVRRDRWRDVGLEIYFQPGHEFDLDRMMRGMKSTLDFCTAAFSPFQFRQLRIVEFPRYGDFAESFPNTIPFSEGIGFITYVNPNRKDAIDLPFFVTAHEVGHQWWAHQVVSADTEGATAIVETLAQYTALMVMQHTYGPESMQMFLRDQLDRYLRGRGQERNEEKPLMRAEPDQGYIHYDKGGLVMYALQDYIGEARVNAALSMLIKAYAFQGPPYPTTLDLIGYLRQVTPPELQYLLKDGFETITLFDNRAVSATCSRTSDGRYSVRIVVEAKKYRSDGKGQQTPVPLDDLVDIGVLGSNGRYLYLQKHKIERQRQEIAVIVDQLPSQAGIDPLIKLIDRNPDDNVVTVESHEKR